MLDGDRATYVAQVPSTHTMRAFTEVGRRVYLHSTGVGKALLAQLDDDRISDLIGRTGLPAATPTTITDSAALLAQIARYAQTVTPSTTVNMRSGCTAWRFRCPIPPTPWQSRCPGRHRRMTPIMVARAIPVLQQAAVGLAADLMARQSSA